MADNSNMEEMLDNFPNQCKEALSLAKDKKILVEIDNIIITGMGGSAIPGDILKSYLSDLKKPVIVNRDYSLPEFISPKSLVFALSYSGNTEETISAYRNALRKGCQIVAVSSGGKLEELSAMNKNIFIKIPSGLQPRAATGYLLISMVGILQNSRIIDDKTSEIKKMISVLKKPNYKKMGEEFASRLVNKIPIIYSSQRYMPAAMKWKTDINENSKCHAFFNTFPEFNHNEIVGFTELKADYFVIIIRDDDEHKQIKKRMDIIKELIKKKGVPVTELNITGDSYLTKLLSALYIGNWVGYFLAQEYDVDPAPVVIIEKLKEMLKH